MVGQLEDFIVKRKKPEGHTGFEDVPVGDWELGCLGRYERVRIDLAVSEPALYTRMAEQLERLANAFRAAAKTPLPAPSDSDYIHERLMVILALDRQVSSVRATCNALWKAEKKKRRAD